MELLLAAIGAMAAGAVGALWAGRRPRLAGGLAATGLIGALVLAAAPCFMVLVGGPSLGWRRAWSVPLGSLALELDALSALFALPILFVPAVAAVYGVAYLPARRNVGPHWCAFNVLAAAMLVVVLARNAVLFLFAWEVMSLAAYFLVIFDADDAEVRRAGWTYLVATHLGTAFLLAMFAWWGRGLATLDFALLAARPESAATVLLLGLVGFGAKAGLIPLHVWLPIAHPAAPSHVSATMSGVMIKMGLYGLVRLTELGPTPPAWWGWTLLGLGAVSATLGILLAAVEGDLKRLLAYSSVENVGIIAIGLGVGLLGVSYELPSMAALGLGGALLHVVNHSLLKSALFLAAGAAVHAAGTRQIDRMGGLIKRMPLVAGAFLVAAVGLCGLPPMNAFFGEALIYVAALSGLADPARGTHHPWAILAVLSTGGLALAGGLAAVGFAKAAGTVFLGEPRTPPAATAHNAAGPMRAAIAALLAASAALALLAPWLCRAVAPAVACLVPVTMDAAAIASLATAAGWMRRLWAVALATGGLVVLLALVRRRLLQGREVARAVTWDCGYVDPSPRMQYSGASFASPLVQVFRLFLPTRVEGRRPEGYFPATGGLQTRTPDAFVERFYRPLFLAVAWVAARLRWFQQGRIQLYVLYIAATLLALLVWKFGL